MKRIPAFITVLVLAMVLLASCSQGVQESTGELVNVTLSATQMKTLGMLRAYQPSEFGYYEFQAIPQFEATRIYGQNLDAMGNHRWMTLVDESGDPVAEGETDGVNLGWFTQGAWKFRLRSVNAQGKILTYGESELVYIYKGNSPEVLISLAMDDTEGGLSDEKGRVFFRVEVPQISEDADDMWLSVDYKRLFSNKSADMVEWTPIYLNEQEIEDWTGFWSVYKQGQTAPLIATYINGNTQRSPIPAQEVGPNKIVYDALSPEMDPGSYIVRIRSWLPGMEEPIGGQTLAVTVIGGEVSEIKGELIAGDFVEAGLGINSPGAVSGTFGDTDSITVKMAWVNRENGEVLTKAEYNQLSEGEKTYYDYKFPPVTLTWASVTSTPISRYTWAVDGNIIYGQTEESYTYTPAGPGQHVVSCIAYGEMPVITNGQVTGSTLGNIGSTAIYVIADANEM
jgi:hypothetical protein